jgi:hypothetical protein
MKWAYIGILTLICITTSCKDAKREKITSLINEWSRKEILFPKDISFNAYHKTSTKDTLIVPKEYSIVSYVDSAGCLKCKMELLRWGKFMYEINSIAKDKVSFMFFFHAPPDKREELIKELRADGFTYPICIDDNDSFNKLNRFPSDNTFHTFLLDRDRKIVLIGDPIHNTKMEELYKRALTGKGMTAITTNKALADALIPATLIDLGDFPWQEQRQASFIVRNTGRLPLIVENVSTSCGCTTVEYSKEPAMPGDSITLTVTYKADRPEYIDKSITVYCNTPDSPYRLKITGKAE